MKDRNLAFLRARGSQPELIEALKKQKKDFVVDREITAKTFARLQTRMHQKRDGKGEPATLYLFDALNMDGQDLRKKLLIERKTLIF